MEKGGAEGLDPKNSAKKKPRTGDDLSASMSKLSIGSKKTKKTKFTMYDCKGSIKSNKSTKTTANFSFAGKSRANDGTVKGATEASNLNPVISITMGKAVSSGILSLGQVDDWCDDELNRRGSVHLMVANGACFEGLDCRKSQTDQKQLMLLFGISRSFTDLEKKLEYLIPRIQEQLGCDENMARKFLKTHPRTLEAKKNLQKLAGSKKQAALSDGEMLLAEIRLKFDFEVAADLVTAEEDPIIHGWTLIGPDESESDEYNFYFEVKEQSKTFKPVAYSADSKKKSTPPPKRNKKWMFGGHRMPNIPEEVSFKSPSKEDASTICTKEQDQLFAKQSSSTKSKQGSKGDGMEVDDESSFDSNLCASDSDEEYEDDSEKQRMAEQLKKQQEQMEKQQKQLDELMNMMSGGAELQKSKSTDGEDSNTSSKKKKGSEGQAEAAGSESVQSQSSRVTRGSKTRDEKRKQQQGNKKKSE